RRVAEGGGGRRGNDTRELGFGLEEIDMKKTMLALAGAVLLASPAMARAQAADTRTTLAVLPFDVSSTNPNFASMGKGFQAMMLNTLSANPKVRIVERDEIQRILD